MTRTRAILGQWLPLAVLATLLCGTVYMSAQHILRMSANEPQIQMAQDAAMALAAGQPADSVVPAAKVDIALSLAPYLTLFDDSGKAIASSGFLHGQAPVLPAGVFDRARQTGENRVTWQPEPGVRDATVIIHYAGARSGFVMAGRSLREAEVSVAQQKLLIGLGWLGSLLATLVAVAFGSATIITMLGDSVATPTDARKILGLTAAGR